MYINFFITIVMVYIQEQSAYADLAMPTGPTKRFEDDSHVVNYGQVQMETKQEQPTYAKLDMQEEGPTQRTQRIKGDDHAVVYTETKQ